MKTINQEKFLNQKGFGAFELIIALFCLAIVFFIGFLVIHNYEASKNTTNTQTSTSLTLAQAVSQLDNIYTTYQNQVLDGPAIQDNSQWALANPLAANDLWFINNHKSWFVSSFIYAANNEKTTNYYPPSGGILMCVSGTINFDNGSFKATGISKNGITAKLDISYADLPKLGGIRTSLYPVTMIATTANSWVIEKVDLSSCSSYPSQ